MSRAPRCFSSSGMRNSIGEQKTNIKRAVFTQKKLARCGHLAENSPGLRSLRGSSSCERLLLVGISCVIACSGQLCSQCDFEPERVDHPRLSHAWGSRVTDGTLSLALKSTGEESPAFSPPDC